MFKFHQLNEFLEDLRQCPNKYLYETPLKVKLMPIVTLIPSRMSLAESEFSTIGKFRKKTLRED